MNSRREATVDPANVSRYRIMRAWMSGSEDRRTPMTGRASSFSSAAFGAPSFTSLCSTSRTAVNSRMRTPVPSSARPPLWANSSNRLMRTSRLHFSFSVRSGSGCFPEIHPQTMTTTDETMSKSSLLSIRCSMVCRT